MSRKMAGSSVKISSREFFCFNSPPHINDLFIIKQESDTQTNRRVWNDFNNEKGQFSNQSLVDAYLFIIWIADSGSE